MGGAIFLFVLVGIAAVTAIAAVASRSSTPGAQRRHNGSGNAYLYASSWNGGGQYSAPDTSGPNDCGPGYSDSSSGGGFFSGGDSGGGFSGGGGDGGGGGSC